MTTTNTPTLPDEALRPINRCNLPAKILGGLAFQSYPVALAIDGVHELHAELFTHLQQERSTEARADYFLDYMSVHFRLHALEEVGLEQDSKTARPRADYLRLLTGWMFDPDQQEGAVLKAWVESRFGLSPRWHRGPIRQAEDIHYQHYLQEAASGLYNTNALESQLDLLYSYAQYELHRQLPEQAHLVLYRGINRLDDYEVLNRDGKKLTLLLNNLNAFSATRERADEFGDVIIRTKAPLSKIFFFRQLLPRRLRGEDEFCIIGGLYQCTIEML